SYHVFESSGQPLRNPLGEVVGFSGIDRDITTRVEMEEALRQSKRDLEAVVEERTHELRQSEEKYRSVIETANEGIFVLKGDKLAFVNPKTSQISGYSQEELLSIPWIELIHPIDKDEVAYQIGDYLSGNIVPEEVERFRMVDKQGNVRWIESNLEFISWEGENAIMAIVSDVTEKVHAESELRDYTEQLDILHQIDQAILAAQSVEEIAHTALDHMKNVIPFTAGSIILFDLETNNVHRLGKVVPDGYELDPEAPLGNQEEELALLRMLERGETFYLAKASKSEQWPGIEKRVVIGLAMETILGVPIILEGDLIGIVMVAAPEAEAFRSNHIDLAHQVGAVLAVALRQARLFEAEQRARQTAETMQSANLALTKSLDLDEVLDTFLEVISEVIPYHSANVMLYEDDKYLVVRASRGYDHFMGGNPDDFPGYSVERIPIFADMKSSHESLLVSNTADYHEWVPTEEGKHISSWIGVPLVSGGAFIGLLALDHTEPDYYTGEHLKVAELMALQATIAIQNANLFEQTTRRARELEEITLISSALRQAKRSEEMFSVLLEEVASFFESDAGVVFLTDQPGFFVSSFRGPEDVPVRVMQHKETMELVWEVAQSGVPLYVSEQPIDSRYQKDINSIAAHPLSTSEGIIGVVLLAWTDQRSFSPTDRRLLKAFADITGNALDRARILETLEQQVSNRTRDLSVLYQVTSVASAHSDLKTITDKSLERILEAVGGNIGTIHVRDPGDQHFQMVSQQGIPDEILGELGQLPMDDQFFGAIAQYNEPLVIMDFTEDSRVPKGLLPLDCEVFIGTPIKTPMIRKCGRALSIFSGWYRTLLRMSLRKCACLSLSCGRLRLKTKDLSMPCVSAWTPSSPGQA
ncbi:MAG: GAF domain-containing protein, partial [Anaerolineales bacterium]